MLVIVGKGDGLSSLVNNFFLGLALVQGTGGATLKQDRDMARSASKHFLHYQ
jgi:hypothetical protein